VRSDPIDGAEDKALRRLTPKHIDLMAKNENFGLQRRAGPEQPGHEAPKRPEEVDHRTQYHPIRRYRPAYFGFAVGTGGVGGYPAPATPALACGPKSDKVAQHGAIRVRSSQSEG